MSHGDFGGKGIHGTKRGNEGFWDPTGGEGTMWVEGKESARAKGDPGLCFHDERKKWGGQ
jgi:hypothetical protein